MTDSPVIRADIDGSGAFQGVKKPWNLGLARKTVVTLFGLAILFPLLSIMRNPILVYLQLLIVLIFAVSATTRLLAIGPIFFAIYGNFFAPMDSGGRFEGTYPSIHTMQIFPAIKGVDILLAIVFILLFRYRAYYPPIKIKRDRMLLVVLSVGMMSCASAWYQIGHPGTFDVGALLFCTRGLLFGMGLHGLCRILDRPSLIRLARASILCCLTIMALAILVPNASSMEREIFGIPLTVAFAGDEYNTLGLLFAACLLLGGLSRRKIGYLALAALLLALIAGRKASLPYFFFVYAMLWLQGRRNSRFLPVLLLSAESFAPWIVLILLIGVENVFIQLAFAESFGILDPTIASLKHLFAENPLYALFGIGPFSKYPLIGLSPMFDHPFAFGGQAGDLYKIKLWFFPFDRLFLNAGLVGLAALLAFMNHIKKYPPAIIYIYLYSVYFFSLNLMSTVMISSLAIAWAAIDKRIPSGGNLRT